MLLRFVPLSSLLAAALLAGCAGLSTAPAPAPADVGVDGIACVGAVPSAPAQFQPSANEGLVNTARLASGKGGVCAAQVYTATAPVVVYRVYDQKNGSASAIAGRWWSLSLPTGPRDGYRAAYGICPEWSALNAMMRCELKPGAQVLLGNTQSVDCAEGGYPKTAAAQLYIPNDGRNNVSYVDHCTDQGTWP